MNITDQLLNALELIKANIRQALLIVGLLWIIQVVNFVLRYRLNVLGIYPRKIPGLVGIFCAPFLHGSFTHLFFNSIPLFVLVDFALANGLHQFEIITLIIMVISGLATCVFGRPGIHVGASSVIMGYFSYLLLNAYQHPSVMGVMLAIVCAYYFGGLLLSIFPQEEKTSWEGHLSGFLAGIAAVYVCSIIGFC